MYTREAHMYKGEMCSTKLSAKKEVTGYQVELIHCEPGGSKENDRNVDSFINGGHSKIYSYALTQKC